MGTCTFLTRYTVADQNVFQTKTQTTKLSSKSGGHGWVTPTQHLSNSLIKAVILSPQERCGWGDRERPEFYVDGLSLHMDGKIRSGEKVNFLNRFGASGRRHRWSFVSLCIPLSTLHRAMLQQMPNKYVLHKQMVPGALCICVMGLLHSKFTLNISSGKPFPVNPSSL